jgi:hypothetical protein
MLAVYSYHPALHYCTVIVFYLSMYISQVNFSVSVGLFKRSKPDLKLSKWGIIETKGQ